jgi:hypothetical protein
MLNHKNAKTAKIVSNPIEPDLIPAFLLAVLRRRFDLKSAKESLS